MKEGRKEERKELMNETLLILRLKNTGSFIEHNHINTGNECV